MYTNVPDDVGSPIMPEDDDLFDEGLQELNAEEEHRRMAAPRTPVEAALAAQAKTMSAIMSEHLTAYAAFYARVADRLGLDMETFLEIPSDEREYTDDEHAERAALAETSARLETLQDEAFDRWRDEYDKTG